MQLRCPNCQGALKEGATLFRCPNCGADLSKLLTPLETGIMTDLGLTLLSGASGLLFSIALLAHVKELRSLFTVILLILGSGLMAWGKAKSLRANERFYWERFWIGVFFASAGAFWTVLMGLSWVWAVALSFIGFAIGYWLCNCSQKQWQKGRNR